MISQKADPANIDDDDVNSNIDTIVESEIYLNPPMASEPLDDTIIELDSKDLQLEKRIQELQRKIKNTKINKWWMPNPQDIQSPFQFNLTPQQLQPAIEIKNQMQESEELQSEIMKLRKDNQDLEKAKIDAVEQVKS